MNFILKRKTEFYHLYNNNNDKKSWIECEIFTIEKSGNVFSHGFCELKLDFLKKCEVPNVQELEIINKILSRR